VCWDAVRILRSLTWWTGRLKGLKPFLDCRSRRYARWCERWDDRPRCSANPKPRIALYPEDWRQGEAVLARTKRSGRKLAFTGGTGALGRTLARTCRVRTRSRCELLFVPPSLSDPIRARAEDADPSTYGSLSLSLSVVMSVTSPSTRRYEES